MLPELTLGIGLTHALVGALIGSRLADRARTFKPSHAMWLGAATSLLALAISVPLFSVYVYAEGTLQSTPPEIAVVTLLMDLFDFVVAGWALILLSAGIGWSLYLFASIAAARDPN